MISRRYDTKTDQDNILHPGCWLKYQGIEHSPGHDRASNESRTWVSGAVSVRPEAVVGRGSSFHAILWKGPWRYRISSVKHFPRSPSEQIWQFWAS